jgi:predicted nucleic acid-binding Zn ribbon protein
MYKGSDAHLENLSDARRRAIALKLPCEFCSGLYSSTGLHNHQKACPENPENRKMCPQCGTAFSGKSETCSRACANTYFRSGERHPNWKESRYRTTCFLHHIKSCVVCGEDNIVEVHHLDEDRDNNDPSNLIPLCPTHHAYWHSRFRYLVEATVTNYLNDWLAARERNASII